MTASYVDLQYVESERAPLPLSAYNLPSGATEIPSEAPRYPRCVIRQLLAWRLERPCAHVAAAWGVQLDEGRDPSHGASGRDGHRHRTRPLCLQVLLPSRHGPAVREWRCASIGVLCDVRGCLSCLGLEQV
eukprot:3317701-Rhodomonas_salina.2